MAAPGVDGDDRTMSTSEPDNPAVDPDTGIPLGAADGEGEAADRADLGPTGDPDDDEPFFQAPEPPAEDSAMSVREQDDALGGPGDVVDG